MYVRTSVPTSQVTGDVDGQDDEEGEGGEDDQQHQEVALQQEVEHGVRPTPAADVTITAMHAHTMYVQ